jgi:hypothetical protein
VASWSLLILSTCITSENVVSSSSENSIGSNKAPNLVGSRIQFVRLKIFIILRRNDLEFNGGQFIWLEVIFPRFKILVCAVYRSPGAVNNFWENLHISIERAFESSPRIIITGDLNVNLLIENDHRLNQIINIFNLTNCIREPTRLGALLDPILFSDELETTFSDVIQVDRIKSDHDATIAFFPIPYDLQTNYKRDVWLYKHGNYDGLNSEIDQFDWNSH